MSNLRQRKAAASRVCHPRLPGPDRLGVASSLSRLLGSSGTTSRLENDPAHGVVTGRRSHFASLLDKETHAGSTALAATSFGCGEKE